MTLTLSAEMTDGIVYELLRFRTRDGEETTVYLVRHPLETTRVSLVCFPEPTRLDHWCAAESHPEAIVAGFFVRDPYRPLGEVRVDGAVVEHEPIGGEWGPGRACVHIDGSVRLAARRQLPPDPGGDLVQAGPLLVSDGPLWSMTKIGRASRLGRGSSTPISPSGATHAARWASATTSC